MWAAPRSLNAGGRPTLLPPLPPLAPAPGAPGAWPSSSARGSRESPCLSPGMNLAAALPAALSLAAASLAMSFISRGEGSVGNEGSGSEPEREFLPLPADAAEGGAAEASSLQRQQLMDQVQLAAPASSPPCHPTTHGRENQPTQQQVGPERAEHAA